MVLAMQDTAQIGGYREWATTGPLARYCEAVWYYEAGMAAPPHRLLPDNKPSLILYYRSDARGQPDECKIAISGSRKRAAWYQPNAGDRQIGLRLYPELAAESAAICPREFQDYSGEAPRAIYDAFARLADSSVASSPRDVAQRLATGFLHYVREVHDKAEHHAARLIRMSGGRYPVSALAEKLGQSERQIRRRFDSVMGITPKAYSCLIRHLNAMKLAEAAFDPDWADIAVSAGYFDQSHMIREIRQLTGISPSRLLAERRAESEISNT
jgi:AraC-like DNA-binding protein